MKEKLVSIGNEPVALTVRKPPRTFQLLFVLGRLVVGRMEPGLRRQDEAAVRAHEVRIVRPREELRNITRRKMGDAAFVHAARGLSVYREKKVWRGV
jgi:hypothetical protein